MRESKRSKEYLPTGYFDEWKLLELLCVLNNKRDKNYIGMQFCLKDEYQKRLPDDFIYHDDLTPEELQTILDSKDKLEVIWSLERYKKYKKLNWWRRILLWLAK